MDDVGTGRGGRFKIGKGCLVMTDGDIFAPRSVTTRKGAGRDIMSEGPASRCCTDSGAFAFRAASSDCKTELDVSGEMTGNKTPVDGGGSVAVVAIVRSEDAVLCNASGDWVASLHGTCPNPA